MTMLQRHFSSRLPPSAVRDSRRQFIEAGRRMYASANCVIISSGNYPDNKVHGANMGPIWGRQDPGGPMLAPWTLLSGMAFHRKDVNSSPEPMATFCQLNYSNQNTNNFHSKKYISIFVCKISTILWQVQYVNQFAYIQEWGLNCYGV